MKNNNILASENFSCGNKHYFLDFRIAKNNSNYICITRSDSQPDGTYTKQCVRVFEEDFHILIGCMSSLFRSAAYHGEQDVRVKDLYRTNKDRRTTGIKSWEPELRPREKMLVHGREEMSNAELLAMLIGSGTPNETAVDLAGRILDSVGGDLLKLSDMSLDDFCGFAGMGVAKSSSILAAMELAKRMYPMLNVSPVRKMRVSGGAVIRPALG
ncbi:UPF0758 domain-containing protein [Pedobacter insulae]|uniref:UPF0758 domain-containing protein n=1 Tax=Pedobacter insulae TaxID=414048 RepID=A0A1I2Z7D6_9SPHI|nr:UPF0758 domain-containing protein [Pedobacter insulae]SFH33772.1 hypothetical protein SAMN04489864_10947 [Pedobacter insulae]